MKVVHLIPDEKFTIRKIQFYDCYLKEDEHEFCIVVDGDTCKYYSGNNPYSLKQRTVRKSDLKKPSHLLRFVKYLKGFDYVVFHGLVIEMVSLFIPARKIVWIEWGSDLYDYLLPGNSLQNKARNLAKKKIRQRIPFFVAIFPPDIDYYKSHLKSRNKHLYYAEYIEGDGSDRSTYDFSIVSRLETAHTNGEPISVLIGHNAKVQLNHLQVLRMLEKYKNENIRVVLSLSYGGSTEYVDQVETLARSLFGEKAVVLKDFIPLEEYIRIIEGIDIAVFDTDRQIGLGNITAMALKKVKLYFRESGVMYPYYLEKGIPVQGISQIQRESFSEFSSPVESNSQEAFREYIRKDLDFNYQTERWKSIFRSLEDIKKKKEQN